MEKSLSECELIEIEAALDKDPFLSDRYSSGDFAVAVHRVRLSIERAVRQARAQALSIPPFPRRARTRTRCS